MSAAGDEDYEHWPSTDQHSRQTTTAPSLGYDTHNGLHFHSYMPAKTNSPSPSEAPPKEPSPQPPVINYPQPVYYAHPPHIPTYPQPQYYSHPLYTVPQGYYQPPYPPAAPPAPAPEPKMHFPSGPNSHVYIPSSAPDKSGGDVPTPGAANAWLGRTTAQVEEDNMKIAKAEGAYDKRKMAPVDLKDDQMCWVVEVDGSHSLRMFRDIKDMDGEWKQDPRYKGAFYFVREVEVEEKKKKK